MAKTVKLLSEDVYRDPMEITLWSRKEPGRYIGRVYQPRHMSFTCWAGETRAKDDVRPPGQTFPYWTGADAIDRAIDAVIAAENAARCAELTPHDSYAQGFDTEAAALAAARQAAGLGHVAEQPLYAQEQRGASGQGQCESPGGRLETELRKALVMTEDRLRAVARVVAEMRTVPALAGTVRQLEAALSFDNVRVLKLSRGAQRKEPTDGE